MKPAKQGHWRHNIISFDDVCSEAQADVKGNLALPYDIERDLKQARDAINVMRWLLMRALAVILLKHLEIDAFS